MHWERFEGGLRTTGHNGQGFAFDNEFPRHRVYLEPYELADRLVTNAEFQAFIEDGGYTRPELWLADGWAQVQTENWTGPLHWVDEEGQAREFTLWGLRPRNPAEPVCHVSGYEADAYARWAGLRLPTEAEWECAAVDLALRSSGRDTHERLHPAAAAADERQYYGACWQWTQSAYGPYPGYRPSTGAIGEYNGKFMSNQWVLRGGSCVTWSSQARPTYRNFFYPPDRWQFSGIRLAR
jgi:ergothioneine biosynthesis protein EgtB